MPSRPETPSRTLINPVLGPKGEPVVSSLPSTTGGTFDCKLNITPDSEVKQDAVNPRTVVLQKPRSSSTEKSQSKSNHEVWHCQVLR